MYKFILLIIFITYSIATPQNINNIYENNKNKLDQIILDKKQEEVYTKIKNDADNKNTYYELKPIELIEDAYEEECVEIENIIFKGNKIIKSSVLNRFKKPYLDNCNGIKKLNNLTKKISNLYITKGFVTSRAYLKMQDLSDGDVEVSIIEGKINKLYSKNVYLSNIYNKSKLENNVLNLKKLEDGINQYNKLQSKKVSLKLLPSKKQGFTDILIIGKNIRKPYYGSVSINNKGSKQTGLYQINTSLTYEDLFGINDIISFSINSTNRVLKHTNKSITKIINYGLPYINNYFKFSYTDFKFHQTILDNFSNEIISNGSTNTANILYEYNLYNSKLNSIKFSSNISRKKNVNYLNSVKLDLQSYIAYNANMSIKHSYKNIGINYYMLLKVEKKLDILGSNQVTQNKNYNKYFLDINYATDILKQHNGKFNTTFHTQYSKSYSSGEEQISIGGPYSVRGYNGASINGYSGFYIRNDISINKVYKSITLSPFMGIDYGYIKHERNIKGGNIIGSSFGLRSSYKKQSLEIVYNKAIKPTEETKQKTKNFIGITYSYNF